jgi:hypothetical protein
MQCYLALVLLAVVSLSSARAESLPEVVSKGLNSLKISGPSAALDAWLLGSAQEKDAAARSKLLGTLSAVEDHYGRSTGYEIIQSFALTPSTLRIYGVILFERGPLYVRWDCYKPMDAGWIIPEFQFDMTAEAVLPPELLFKK